MFYVHMTNCISDLVFLKFDYELGLNHLLCDGNRSVVI